LSLALQGGGAHGAFTWGVLDRLLEDERLVIDGISGASAGAMNGAALASGWHSGGREGARQALEALWERVSDVATLAPPPAAAGAFDLIAQIFSPYHFNPLDVNPLRRILEEVIDFDALQRGRGIKLFVSATDVRLGHSRVFENRDLTVDALLASACLPHLHKAIEIDDAHYWDGAYTANPSIFPVVFGCKAGDVAIIQIEPLRIEDLPMSARQIENRRSQIVFNASLYRELDGLAYMRQISREARGFMAPVADKVRRLKLHLIEGGEHMAQLDISSKRKPDWHFVSALRDVGRGSAEAWLQANFAKLGKRGTVALR
jgi:NTE family protein